MCLLVFPTSLTKSAIPYAVNIPAKLFFSTSQVVSPDRKAQLPVYMERVTERTA